MVGDVKGRGPAASGLGVGCRVSGFGLGAPVLCILGLVRMCPKLGLIVRTSHRGHLGHNHL